jgi:hypothetical protein
LSGDTTARTGNVPFSISSSYQWPTIPGHAAADYLILVGVIGLFAISLGQLAIVVPLLALVAGVFLLIGK